MRQARYDASYKYRAQGAVKNYGGNTCVTMNTAGVERGFERLGGKVVYGLQANPLSDQREEELGQCTFRLSPNKQKKDSRYLGFSRWVCS